MRVELSTVLERSLQADRLMTTQRIIGERSITVLARYQRHLLNGRLRRRHLANECKPTFIRQCRRSANIKPRLHDTTCCQTRCQTGCTNWFDNRLNEQLFVQHGCQTGCQTRLTTGLTNRLDVCLHDTTGCQSGCTTGLTTGCTV